MDSLPWKVLQRLTQALGRGGGRSTGFVALPAGRNCRSGSLDGSCGDSHRAKPDGFSNARSCNAAGVSELAASGRAWGMDRPSSPGSPHIVHFVWRCWQNLIWGWFWGGAKIRHGVCTCVAQCHFVSSIYIYIFPYLCIHHVFMLFAHCDGEARALRFCSDAAWPVPNSKEANG